ncbi:MAG: hypothetical protein QNJ97_25540 [Myxococcota bacterium]|nr:hypothetical protein [Myxococcota bacterium]
MLIVADTIDQIKAKWDQVIGFWGVPPREKLISAASELGLGLVDLDVAYGAPASRHLPSAYCHIIRNCVDNAIALGPRLRHVIAATGREKCDAGRYAAWLVRQETGVTVEVTENHEQGTEPRAPHVCEARGSLKARVVRIMRSIVHPLDEVESEASKLARCAPTHGFWGTPPHPIGILDLFPETTHIFGWTRCVAEGAAADLTLETDVPVDLPIVFFSQGFCPKGSLAHYLAQIHRGMHVDIHEGINAAIRAKIEAFIRLTSSQEGP